MARLIDDLLDISRIDRGQIELRREHLALDTVVAAAIESVTSSMESKHSNSSCATHPATSMSTAIRCA